MFGLARCASILPTSQDNTLLTGSKAYFPWLTVKVQFKTDLGIGISTFTDSNCKIRSVSGTVKVISQMLYVLTVRPIVCLGDMVMSNFPVPFAEKVKLCRKLIGMATVLWEPIRYDISLKLPSGGINERIRSAYSKEINKEIICSVPNANLVNYLPSLEPNTRMETCIIKHSWIHKRHAEIWHAGQLYHAVNVPMNFWGNCSARLINDGIHFFDNVKVCFIVGILDSWSSPRDIW